MRVDPLRSRRSLALALLALAAGASYWYLEAQTIANRCAGGGPVATGYRHEWTWSRFTYVCIYRNRRGDDVARRFPDRPSLRDLG